MSTAATTMMVGTEMVVVGTVTAMTGAKTVVVGEGGDDRDDGNGGGVVK